VFFLDDPFASVDSATGSMMFQQGVKGVLANTLRLVTLNSHLNLLPGFDRILVLEDGRIVFDGPFHALALAKPLYAAKASEETAMADGATGVVPAAPVAASTLKLAPPLKATLKATLKAKTPTPQTFPGGGAASGGRKGGLIKGEGKAVGSVSVHAYVSYVGAGLGIVTARGSAARERKVGAVGGVFLFLVFVAAQGVRVASDLACANWAEKTTAPTGHSNNAQQQRLTSPVTLYVALVGLTVAMLVARSSLLIAVASRASACLHAEVLASVLRASVPHFFDTHTVGAVLNRFGKDVENLDVQIPEFLQQVRDGATEFISVWSVFHPPSEVPLT
jgi:ABC-type multidrug transport system fused ATPase/permease subunit